MKRTATKVTAMGFKEQFGKLKDNWLIIALALVLLLVISGGGNLLRTGASMTSELGGKSMVDAAYYRGGYYPPTPAQDGDFAPGVEERVILKSATLSTQIERHEYDVAERQLKGIVAEADGLILEENVQRYGETGKEYRQGTYQLKVPVSKYGTVIGDLKELGEVQSFHENAQDVTGESIDLKTDLATEQSRLDRYRQMLREAGNIDDKLALSDRIFEQERRVAYLQERIKNVSDREDYASVMVSLNEEPSAYQNIAIVEFSTLWRNLVTSLNGLLEFVFLVIPWAITAGIIAFVWRIVKRRNA